MPITPATDPLLTQLAERVRSRAGVSAQIKAPNSVYDWAMRYRQIDGRPFSLARYKPLQALYEDDWNDICVMKPAQRGVSEWAICLTCYALEYGAQRWVSDGSKAGLNVGIIFPAKADLNDFSKERLSDLKSESTHLANLFGGDEFDALGFKKVGDSFLYLRGGYSRAGLRSFPADMIILDEFDELNTSAVSLAKRRMNASLVNKLIKISTPSLPGKGISAEYLASDQRVYQTQCPACHTWQTFDFFRDVRVEDAPWEEWQKWSQSHVASSPVRLHCPACDAVQDDKARCATGRWIMLNPDAKVSHGYHIPWWPWVFVRMERLAISAVSSVQSEVEELYHSDLGLPFGMSEGGVTDALVEQLSAMLPDGLPDGPWRDTTMGCDIGSTLHYRISSTGPDGSVYVRAMGTVPNWMELDNLMLKYKVRQAVVDGEPEWHDSKEFCERWQGRAARAYYPTGVSALKGTLFHQKPNTYDIQINRDMALDTVYHTILKAQELWPREITRNPEVVKQLTSSVRVKISDEKTGVESYTWVHGGPDHFTHACFAAGTLVMTKRGPVPIEELIETDSVMTRTGLQNISAVGMTSPESEVWRYTFSNGRTLIATPNHPVWTENRGFVAIHELTHNDVLSTLHNLPTQLTQHVMVGKQSVYNLSVNGSEEYFANGILVHNCGYDLVARRMLPTFKNQQPAVGGERVVFSEYPVSPRQLRESGPSPSLRIW